MRHAILFLQHIFWYCSTMLLLSVCLRLSDDKFRENNAIICPASYSYYSTNHNDGVEDYFIRQIMDNFKTTVRLMLCICCRRACVDRTSKTAFNFSKHYVKLFCKPLSNFAKVFSGISLNEKGYRLLCVASRRFVS